MSVNTIDTFVKVGFFAKFNELKNKHKLEIENCTTRFQLTWQQSPQHLVKIGKFKLKHFLSKYITMAIGVTKFISTETVRPTLVIVLDKITFPVDETDIKKIKLEFVLVNEFMELFSLYQLKITKDIDDHFVMVRFMDAINWLQMTIKAKHDYAEFYFKSLARKAFGLSNRDSARIEDHVINFVDFAKQVDIYPQRFNCFMHDCIIDIELRFMRTLELINMVTNNKKHTEPCGCVLCEKCEAYLIQLKNKN